MMLCFPTRIGLDIVTQDVFDIGDLGDIEEPPKTPTPPPPAWVPEFKVGDTVICAG